MAKLRITKEFRFEMAHVLTGHDGLCSNLHGHSYLLKVTVIGRPIEQKDDAKLGMVIDFGDLKRLVQSNIVERFDHAVAVLQGTPMHKMLAQQQLARLVDLPFQPTCENLLTYFAQILNQRMPKGVKLHHLRLHETASSYAEWFADDNPDL